jgi:hypothetical protein
MLTQEDKQSLLSEFPNLKLSYETITHKKVYNSDIMLAIPVGIKCFAWFTIFNDKFVCVLFELENNKNKEIKNIKIINTCFSKSLCYGTILYGTLFNHINNNFFSIEDIFFYKDRDLSGENWLTKFNKIIDILKNDIKQISYNKNFIIFGLPVIAYSNENLETILRSSIKYQIDSIQYYKSTKSNKYFSLPFDKFNSKIEIVEQREIRETERIPKYIILEVKPDIQNDIYNLYSFENIFCGTACIPDYKTSIMMNKLFRNIKENDDLDKLEESDDEEEFENPNIDKFVYLEKSFKMKCHYNKKFKKWTPIEVVKGDTNKNIEINNFISNLYESNKKTTNKKK